MKYRIVSASYQDTFVVLVQQALNSGWTCQGGVSVHHGGFSQAMILDQKIEPPFANTYSEMP